MLCFHKLKETAQIFSEKYKQAGEFPAFPPGGEGLWAAKKAAPLGSQPPWAT